MLSKYTIALIGLATLVFMALDLQSRRWFRHGAPYGAVLLCGGHLYAGPYLECPARLGLVRLSKRGSGGGARTFLHP